MPLGDERCMPMRKNTGYSCYPKLCVPRLTSLQNIPFDYSNRRTFAIKCIAYMGFGFALPFVAVGWQWYKPGGYKNPL
ncbi:hypothetical protein B0H14DRAFT_1151065 [Mycena olivaceomarginata]|nr:hypothetical protein B0H14DRAFT_2811997 [Mycena olivaceomarginata]KAJ7889857.1 hypothetical protein B0H14DRAFT_1151065 [Mycena olivaceomarginata]